MGNQTFFTKSKILEKAVKPNIKAWLCLQDRVKNSKIGY